MAKIHIMSVCGKLMAGVATLAKQMGFGVIGYDVAFEQPMASQLSAMSITCVQGYSLDQLQPGDTLIVGNSIHFDNPMVQYARVHQIKIKSAPEWLSEHVLADREVIAICGTHGKTTLATWCVQVFHRLGIKVGYLVGGMVPSTNRSADFGDGRCAWFVIEADEYDTAFFDKRPKFLHYWPRWVLINNIEFDHADIYSDLNAMVKQYQLLEKIVHPNGCVLIDHEAAKYLKQPVKTFGINQSGLDYQGSYKDQHLVLHGQSIACWGQHNAHNLLGLYALFEVMGVSLPKEALQSLSMPVRRCQLMMEYNGVQWFDDFAHHPTAINAVYRTLVERYGKVALVIHPSTYTQRSKFGFDQLLTLMADAPYVAILPDKRQEVIYDLPDNWQYVADQSQAALWAQEQPVSAVCVMSSQYLAKIFEAKLFEVRD